MKLGTLASETNYIAWQEYVPSRFWLVSLYDAQKLEHSQYVALSAQFGSGHAERRRDALQILGDMGEEAVDKHVFAEAAALAASSPRRQTRTIPAIEDFVCSFRSAERRRPILLLVGERHARARQLPLF